MWADVFEMCMYACTCVSICLCAQPYNSFVCVCVYLICVCMCMCMCVCVCARARVLLRACVCVCVCVRAMCVATNVFLGIWCASANNWRNPPLRRRCGIHKHSVIRCVRIRCTRHGPDLCKWLTSAKAVFVLVVYQQRLSSKQRLGPS